jgi:hypothetical protein
MATSTKPIDMSEKKAATAPSTERSKRGLWLALVVGVLVLGVIVVRNRQSSEEPENFDRAADPDPAPVPGLAQERNKPAEPLPPAVAAVVAALAKDGGIASSGAPSSYHEAVERRSVKRLEERLHHELQNPGWTDHTRTYYEQFAASGALLL